MWHHSSQTGITGCYRSSDFIASHGGGSCEEDIIVHDFDIIERWEGYAAFHPGTKCIKDLSEYFRFHIEPVSIEHEHVENKIHFYAVFSLYLCLQKVTLICITL